MNWFKSALSTVVGTEEPIYGPEAIQSVAKQAEETPYSELTKEDLKWKAMQWTCVETQTFYFISDKGDLAMIQLLYSNVAGIHTTAHLNTKIFSPNKETPHLWCSDPIPNYMFDDDMLSFGGDNVALTLNEDGTAYTLKSALNDDCLINLTITRLTPGFCVGKDGTSTFGTDPQNPWGSMRHAFWPKCKVEGTVVTPDREVDFTGRGFFAHALQGMKPHHLAARWNFANFQGPTYSAALMEFTTPASYGNTVVTVGGIVKDSEIITASASCTATHLETTTDSENEWPEPTAVKFTWAGKTKDGKDVDAVLEGQIGERLDRVDVMAEVPGFIKSIIGSVAGTKPYVYQYSPPHKLTLKLRIGGEEITEEGTLYSEATFIS